MGQCVGKTVGNQRNTTDDAEAGQESMELDNEMEIVLEAEPNALKSIFSRDIVFNNDTAVISFCQKKIHALLFVELAEAKNDLEDSDQQFRRIIWRGDLMPTPHGNRIMQKGDVRVIEIGAKCRNDEELENDVDFNEKCSKMIVLQSKLISRNDAEQLVINMKNAHNVQDTNYALTGPSTESSIRSPLKGGCDNCVTWVKRMLGSINISTEATAMNRFFTNSAAYAAGFNKQ